jgi:hypothetical protein
LLLVVVDIVWSLPGGGFDDSHARGKSAREDPEKSLVPSQAA